MEDLQERELWLMAEQRTLEMLFSLQPALLTDRSRKKIIDYVKQLIKNHYGTEVFSFGSVPLKTYLPDGDIDLTILSHLNMEDNIANGLCELLEGEQRNSDFKVTEVTYVRAQVKVVKCSIRNIAVDISFNQMEGLCALCFLEEVDQMIGRDHLFKRSIILVKAWCYYESQILGANNGLISTYALETLVLYIINAFYSKLHGPLAVLIKFLQYYGTFDWDTWCVSILGPVPIASLPDILVTNYANDGDELLLNQEFLRSCKETYSIPIKAVETNYYGFSIKHLNIVDPLQGNNNLGRSVSRGNASRIKSAFFYGAQRLQEILTLPDESMFIRLESFFTNALERNGKGQRHDLQAPVASFGSGRSELSDLTGDYYEYYKSLVYGQWYHNYILPTPNTLPSILSVHDVGTRDFPGQFLHTNSNNFIPNVPCPYASQLPFYDQRMSRGTGTYIPILSYCSQKVTYSYPRTSNIVPTGRPSLKPPKPAKKVKDIPGPSNAQNSLSDLMTNQPASLETHQVDNTMPQLPQAEHLSPSRGSTNAVTTPPTKPEGSPFLSPSASGTLEERVVDEPYQLEDANDFPPLSKSV